MGDHWVEFEAPDELVCDRSVVPYQLVGDHCVKFEVSYETVGDLLVEIVEFEVLVDRHLGASDSLSGEDIAIQSGSHLVALVLDGPVG